MSTHRRGSRRFEGSSPSRGATDLLGRFDRPLLQTVDLAFVALLLVAPLVMGGRHPVGELVYVALAGLAASAWVIRWALGHGGRVHRTGAEWLLVAAVLIVAAQLVTLPTSIVSLISPVREVLPLWQQSAPSIEAGYAMSDAAVASAQLGDWTQLTLAPYATRGSLVMLLAYVMLLLVAIQRLRSLRDVERLLQGVALAAVSMALFGLLQYVTSNGKFCWIYEDPYRNTDQAVVGSFVNANHFCHFLVLGVGPLLWWCQDRWRHQVARPTSGRSSAAGPAQTAFPLGDALQAIPWPLLVAPAALGVVAFAGLLSYSRGGLGVMFLAGATCAGIYAWRSLLGRRSLAALAGISLVVAIALALHGQDKVERELGTLAVGDSLEQLANGRQQLWSAVAEGIADFTLVGAGAGSHAEVYPIYYDQYTPVEYTHAESGYLQVMLETGVGGLFLLICGLVLWGHWSVRPLFPNRAAGLSDDRRRRIMAAGAAVLAGLVASCAHAVVDFVWYIPACASVTLLLVAAAARLAQFAAGEPDEQRSRRPSAPGQKPETGHDPPVSRLASLWELPLGGRCMVAASVVLISLGMVQSRLGPARAAGAWNHYLALSQASAALEQTPVLTAPADAAEQARLRERRQELSALMIAELEQTLAADPAFPRGNLRLAALLLERFDARQRQSDNAMPLSQIRDAALASGFPSLAAQDRWLAAAVGENRRLLDRALYHAQIALAGCPLQGEAYLQLAELGFLQQRDAEAKQAFVGAALAVRPHHAGVLFFAGREAALAGDVDEALQYWRAAFHHGPQYRRQIASQLGAQLEARQFVETFQPDREGLAAIYQQYRATEQDAQAAYIGPLYAKDLVRQAELTTGPPAANAWYEAHKVYRWLEDKPRSLAAVRRATQTTPDNFFMRRALGIELLEQRHFNAAVDEFQWCLHHRPNDSQLEHFLRTALKARLTDHGDLRQAAGERADHH